jgi:hypothetical protein
VRGWRTGAVVESEEIPGYYLLSNPPDYAQWSACPTMQTELRAATFETRQADGGKPDLAVPKGTFCVYPPRHIRMTTVR